MTCCDYIISFVWVVGWWLSELHATTCLHATCSSCSTWQLTPRNMFNLLRPHLINAVSSFHVLSSRCSSSGRHVDSARRSTSYLYVRTHLNHLSPSTQLNYQYTPLPGHVFILRNIIHTGKENAPLSMPRQEIALPYTKIQCSAPSNPVPNRIHVNLCNSLSLEIRLLRQGIRPCRHA